MTAAVTWPLHRPQDPGSQKEGWKTDNGEIINLFVTSASAGPLKLFDISPQPLREPFQQPSIARHALCKQPTHSELSDCKITVVKFFNGEAILLLATMVDLESSDRLH